MKKPLKIILIVFGSIIALFLTVFGGFNLLKFAIYSDYYEVLEKVCENPGLNDGAVPQGIAYVDGTDKIISSSYMTDNSHSRIYVSSTKGSSYYVKLLRNNKKFTGHVGGIAVSSETVYLANNDKIYSFPLSSLLESSNGDYVEIGSGVSVNNQASFVHSDDEHLYVGEFHDGGKYVTDHPYETSKGTQHAIISKYSLEDLTSPVKIYSIRDKVQGCCFTPEGKIVLSTSYGLTDSHFYVYDESSAVDSNLTLDGAPVYFLTDHYKDIKAPAMSEDLDYYNGKILTYFESACNKYIFGKFFFANYIAALKLF